MGILVATNRQEEETGLAHAAENPSAQHMAIEPDVVAEKEESTGFLTTLFSWPGQLWRLIVAPNEDDLRFFLRDGLHVEGGLSGDDSGIDTLEIAPRINVRRDDAEEMYMLTWQPQASFVRRANLIHEPADSGVIPEAKYINSEEPLVYIFNSHPHELIGAPGIGRYREGNTNILEFSHMMANIFADYRIPVLVEDRDVRDVLNANGWHFDDSYRASRIFLEERIHQHPSLAFFFDLHRDAIPDTAATVEIGGKRYARIIFVIGLENPAYEENYEMAMRLHDMLEAVRPGISRGILPSFGPFRNGVYNQDVAPTLQLIEIGSYQSTPSEMVNATEILAAVLAEYILLYVGQEGVD